MTREQLIQAIYDDLDEWSCPDSNCDKYEQDNCMACVECQLKEYEDRIYQQGRADAIDEFVSMIISHCKIVGNCDFDDLRTLAQQLKEKKNEYLQSK